MARHSQHCIRFSPAVPGEMLGSAEPDGAQIFLGNGGGQHPAGNIVSGDFLQLVRLGVRAASDPLIADSVAVIDHLIMRKLPQGDYWRRYHFDGCGQKADGAAYDGSGKCRCWPLLTGERGHYELAAGRDLQPLIQAMKQSSNEGRMLPEQLWDADDLPQAKMVRGRATGAAMPLCWAHAEYMELVRSRKDDVCFDRVELVYQRYATRKVASQVEMWTFAHQSHRVAKGETLRMITQAAAIVRWSVGGGVESSDVQVQDPAVGCWFVDLATDILAAETRVEFKFQWNRAWEGENFNVLITEVSPIHPPSTS